MNLSKRHIILTIGGSIVIGIIVWCSILYYRLAGVNLISRDGEEYGYYIYPGTTIDSVLTLISDHYDLKSPMVLDYYIRYTDFVRPSMGYYKFPSKVSTKLFINRLHFGMQTPIKLCLTDQIRTKYQLASRLSQQLLIDSTTIVTLLDSTEYLNTLGFTPENIPCMFIPNTYEVYWTITVEELFQRFHKEYNTFWDARRCKQAHALNLTPIEVSILGSIATSETNKSFEIPIIARLYMNRLRKGIYLQACPTVIYACGDFTMHRVLNRHLNIVSPYNTYRHRGLPPGPIRLTYPSTMDAILNSQPNDYLYMCANSAFDETHIFSVSFAQHSRAAREYQRELNKRNIKK